MTSYARPLFVMAICWVSLPVRKCNSHNVSDRLDNGLPGILFTFDFLKRSVTSVFGSLGASLASQRQPVTTGSRLHVGAWPNFIYCTLHLTLWRGSCVKRCWIQVPPPPPLHSLSCVNATHSLPIHSQCVVFFLFFFLRSMRLISAHLC